MAKAIPGLKESTIPVFCLQIDRICTTWTQPIQTLRQFVSKAAHMMTMMQAACTHPILVSRTVLGVLRQVRTSNSFQKSDLFLHTDIFLAGAAAGCSRCRTYQVCVNTGIQFGSAYPENLMSYRATESSCPPYVYQSKPVNGVCWPTELE